MKLSCYLIGEDSLLIQCGNILLTRKHAINLVITPIKSIQIWAEHNAIPWISSLSQLPIGQEGVVDIIFSIVNSYILTPDLLKMARLGVFNYHDSILPHYAGLNAAIWALVHNEHKHGITWHLVNEHIDQGDIVNQRIVPIQNNETALTLNLRCYEEAIHGFNELITGIETNSLIYQKQLIEQGSSFGIRSVLPDLGFINWETAFAECIERMSRALSLEYYNNPVGQLKLALPNTYLIVSQIEILPYGNPEYKPSGVILALEQESMVIAVGDQAVRIHSFTSARGMRITHHELEQNYGLYVGYQCPHLESRAIEALAPLVCKALHSESYWVEQLQTMQDHNTLSSTLWKERVHLKEAGRISLTKAMQNNISQPEEFLLTGVLTYLYRLNNYQKTHLFVIQEASAAQPSNLDYLFAHLLPLSIDFTGMSFTQAALDIAHQLMRMHSKGAYLADIFARYPALSEMHFDGCISVSFSTVSLACTEHSLLHFEIDAERGHIIIYHRIDIKRMALLVNNIESHLQAFVEEMFLRPTTRIHEFCFLSKDERHLLNIWGQGEKKALPGTSIIALFDERVRLSPNHTAIYCGVRRITYKQLQEKAEQVAAYIQQLRLPEQSFIGLYMPRSDAMLAVILGILKAGCVFVPLEEKCPALKIKRVVKKAGLMHVISNKDSLDLLLELFPDIKIHALEDMFCLKNAVFKPIRLSHVSNTLAYVMFTSGTTGAPKGVKVSEINVINYCNWFATTNQLDSQSIIDFSSSLAFDLSIPCTIAPLITGATIAIAQEQEKRNPGLYLQHLQRFKVTHSELTPGYLRLLLQYPEEIKQLSHLHYLLLGADDVRCEEVMQWLSLCPHQKIINEYGPTETTVSVTSFAIEEVDLLTQITVPIGKPGFNSSCYVYDAHLNLCPIGMKGELLIGGKQVSDGYLLDLELTSKQFIRINNTESEEILYRSGDLVCWLPDGNLQFFGRNDQQVKIQGYRVELPAIESVLMKLEGIHQAIVVVHHDILNEKYLRAYCVPHNNPPSIQEMKAFLDDYLPAYMHPKEFFIINSIPLIENEKIDYAKLEQQGNEIRMVQQEFFGYQDSVTESCCRSIWQEAFHVQGIRVDEDFFALGGDSMIALQIISALKKHYHINLSLSLLFEYPTIRSLAAKIDALVDEDGLLAKEEDAHSLALVKLAQGTNPIPLFLVHPVGGSIFWYQQLAQVLDGKYTVYGIQDINFDGTGQRFASLQAMASYYLSEISKVYEGESYCLGGASFGATVAFAMAHQLVESGKKIQFLGLFDGWAQYPASIMESESDNLLVYGQNTDKADSLHLKQLEDYRKKLLIEYPLPILKSDITLFKAQELWEPFSAINDEYNGWRPYVQGEIHIVVTPGTHETMFFMPHIAQWAEYIL